MKSLKVNALANVSIKILNIVFPLITGPYIARVLSKSGYGNFNIANTLINLFIPFATLGVYTYAVREISKVLGNKDEINKVFSKLFYVSAFSTIVTTIIYYIYICFFYGNQDVKILCYILGLQIFVQMFYIEWMNEAFENYKFILYKTLVIRLMIFLGLFIFVKKEDDIIPYAILMTVLNSLNILISYFWIKKDVKFVRVELSKFKELVRPMTSIFLLMNANMMYTVLDRMFLSYISLPEYVTYYTVSQNIIMMIIGVISGAITVNFPRMSYYLGQNDESAYRNLLKLISSIYSFFIMPISIGMMLLSTYVVLLYGGSKYVDAGIVMAVFSIRIIALSIDVILGNLIIFIKGYEKNLIVHYLIGGIINFILNGILAFTNLKSPEYFVVTTMISEIIVIFIHTAFIKKLELFEINEIMYKSIKYFVIAFGFIPIYILYNLILPIYNVIDIYNLIKVSIFILICFAYYMFVNFIIKDDTFKYLYSQVSRIVLKVLRK